MKEVTRPISRTCIDNIITNKKFSIESVIVSYVGLPDHKAIWFSLPKLMHEKKRKTVPLREEGSHQIKQQSLKIKLDPLSRKLAWEIV